MIKEEKEIRRTKSVGIAENSDTLHVTASPPKGGYGKGNNYPYNGKGKGNYGGYKGGNYGGYKGSQYGGYKGGQKGSYKGNNYKGGYGGKGKGKEGKARGKANYSGWSDPYEWSMGGSMDNLDEDFDSWHEDDEDDWDFQDEHHDNEQGWEADEADLITCYNVEESKPKQVDHTPKPQGIRKEFRKCLGNHQ